jgi:hypothetical protein
MQSQAAPTYDVDSRWDLAVDLKALSAGGTHSRFRASRTQRGPALPRRRDRRAELLDAAAVQILSMREPYLDNNRQPVPRYRPVAARHLFDDEENAVAFWELLLQQTSSAAGGARSTALAPLQIPFALLLAATVYASVHGAPWWLSGGLGVAAVVFAPGILKAYFIFAKKMPDALGSERYSLRKMEIRHVRIGDVETLPLPGEKAEARSRPRVTGRTGIQGERVRPLLDAKVLQFPLLEKLLGDREITVGAGELGQGRPRSRSG